MSATTVALLLLAAGLVLYGVRVNHVMLQTPPEAQAYLEPPLTADRVRQVYRRVKEQGIDWHAGLPPRRDRRYVIVGGSGLVGGQIALSLLAVGVPPQAIRLLDIRPPTRSEFSSGAAAQVAFVKTDVTSEAEVESGMGASWAASVSGLPLTVFHTAAVIRPQERDPVLYHRCSRVNVAGTAHALSAARKAGAGLFILTSSSNAGSRGVQWLFPPWRRQPRHFAQFIGDDDFSAGRPGRAAHEFPSNYAASKAEAERLVCGSDAAEMRTAAIRPGNGVYGHRDDHIIAQMLGRPRMPTFAAPWAQSWAHVGNVALAHLLLEAALLGPKADKVAGRPFMISDGGAPLRFRDVYTVLGATASTGFSVSHPPPVAMLLLAYGVEAYCRLLARLPARLQGLVPEPGEPLCMLQPGTIASSVTSITDTSTARRRPDEGGLGYRPLCTTLEGLCAQVRDWNEWVEAGGREER
ncbi:hypothetical protein CDD83_7854 [Cordyceps sp. RAO-2017]|nr:hypothetical protein CDD83_7854 [Cordyceps sp. RAO-2017]